MGVIREKWRSPKCNVDVSGSMGELKNHIRKVHAAKSETRFARAA